MQRGLAGYRLLRRLSGGGQGNIYLAIDERLQRRVVIKLYHLGEELAGRQRAIAEARNLARMEGMRIVRIHDVVASGRQLALVMQYVPGCDLAVLLAQKQTLPPALALGVALDVTAGLAVIHRHQWVHGDLKAANVLLDLRGRATLIDFGISAPAGRRAIGVSREAVTPEHLQRISLTPQSDLFALGILLYRMLYARHPFAVDGVPDPVRICAGLVEVPVLEGVHGQPRAMLCDLLNSLLSVRPEERPASARVVRTTLRAVRAQLPVDPGERLPIASLARDEDRQGDLPALPRRLVKLPRLQRWWAALAALWRESTDGARLFLVAAGSVIVAVPALLLAMPGPCLELRPLRLDADPGTAVFLPAAPVLEQRVMARLRAHYRRSPILGQLPESDSRRILQLQGLRDICIAERSLEMEMHCRNRSCRIQLASFSPRGQFRSEQRLPVDEGIVRLRQGIDQLVDRHVEAMDH